MALPDMNTLDFRDLENADKDTWDDHIFELSTIKTIKFIV